MLPPKRARAQHQLEKSGDSLCINAAYGIIKLLLPIFHQFPVYFTRRQDREATTD